ncbi:MAG: formate dehydrogenase subunit delta [Actinomycetota bacterium]|nr:formate dehydrogenase subunit delta [Actinomycetota bacterium]
MSETRIVELAEDIARNLAYLPDEQSADAIATHVRSFWDPRMIAQLSAIVAADPSAVRPTVAKAVSLLG